MYVTTTLGDGRLLFGGAGMAPITSSDLPQPARRKYPARQWGGHALARLFPDMNLNDRNTV